MINKSNYSLLISLFFWNIFTLGTTTNTILGNRHAGLQDPGDVLSTRQIDINILRRAKRDAAYDKSVHDPWMDLELDIEGERVVRRLYRSADQDDVPLYEMGDSGLRIARSPESSKQYFAAYTTNNGDSAITVLRDVDGNHKMEGSLSHNGMHFLIQPSHRDKKHVIHKLPERMALEDEDIKIYKRQRDAYEVEVLLVFDPKLFQLLSSRIREDPYEYSKFYALSLINEMDRRYKTMSGLNLRVVSAGLLILKDQFPTQLYDGKDSGPILDALSNWGRTSLPKFDNVQFHLGVIFGGNVLGLAWMDAVCNSSQSSFSIISNNLRFRTASVAAHELGHNMGIPHDDGRCLKNYIMGPTVVSNIMSKAKDTVMNVWKFSPCSVDSVSNYIRKLNIDNKLCLKKRTGSTVRFGSFGNIRGVIKYSKNEVEHGHIDTDLYGLKYTYDEQCAHMRENSKFCRSYQLENMKKLDDICLGIYCSVGTYCTEFFSMTGTPCGHKKICLYGKCVSDDRGIEMNEKCPFGDEKEDIQTYVNYKTVTFSCQKAKRSPYMCYYIESECCETCPKLRNSRQANCEYGDKPIEFKYNGQTLTNCKKAVKVFPGVCYKYSKECCISCPSVLDSRAPNSCRYGDYDITERRIKVNSDLYSTCKEAIAAHPNLCGLEESVRACCASCKPILDSKKHLPGSCKFDYPGRPIYDENRRLVSCTDAITRETPGMCYNRGVAQDCCATCYEFKRPNQNCQYGDRYGRFLNLNGVVYTCVEVVKKLPAICYQHSGSCCESCEKIKQRKTGCEYGDKPETVYLLSGGFSDCSAITQETSGYCYQYATKCCETCAKLSKKRSNPSCEYGDRMTEDVYRDRRRVSCKKGIDANHKFLCYLAEIEKSCCYTCKSYASNDPQCKYGDHDGEYIWKNSKIYGCRDGIDSSNSYECYKNDKKCCETCKKFKTSDTSCLYGDKNHEFRAITINRRQYFNCQDAYAASASETCRNRASACCKSCSRYRG